MQKWEYLLVQMDILNNKWFVEYVNGKDTEKEFLDYGKKPSGWTFFTRAGADGWELVSVERQFYIFKRAKVE